MDSQKETVRIFTGPSMIGHGLIARLLDLGISPIVKDDHQSGITGGFATGVPNQVRLFIRREELEKSSEVIESYLKEVEEPQ